MALSTYSCNVCEEPLVKSTAYVKHLRSDDWQGHRPVTCKDCYEKEDEYESKYTDKEWRRTCKARWSELDGVIEDGAKRARVKKWSELEQSVRKDYPEASRSERRKATLFAIQKVARYIALKISQAPPEQRRQREQAFVEFDAEWDKKVADPEYVPEVRAYKMSDHAAQWASEIIEGLSEHFICRHRDCRECSRSCDWLMKGADQYGCPLCLRQYRRPTGHGFSSSWPDTTMATLINKFKEITAKLDAVLDGVPEKEQWRFVCSELQAKAAHPLTTQFLSPENIEELKRLNSTMRSPWRYDHILDKGFWSFRLADHGVANLDQPLSQDDVLSMFAWSKWLLRQYSGSRLYIHDPVKQGSLTEALAQATHRVFPPFAPELADTRATSRPRGAATVGAPWPRRLPAKRRGDAGVTRSAKALCTRRGESRTLPGPPVPEESAAKAPASLVAPDAPAGRGVGRRSLAQRAAAGRTLSRLVLLMDMHFFHEPVVFGTADPPRPRGGLVAISGGQLAFILGAFTRRGKPLADIAPLVACRDGGRDLLKASHSHATTCPASYLVDVGLHCAVATGVADRRGASILFEDVRESRCALPEPKADDLRQIRQAAQAWAGGDIELPCDGSCHVDHSVGEIIPAGEKRLRSMAESRAVARRAMPTPRARADRRGGARGAAVSRSPRTGLQKHLDEQKALGAPHHAAINSEDHKCFWVLDLPLPRQFDARRRRCRTCAAAGLPNRYFATDVSDVVAAVPGVLHLRLEKQGSVLMTKQFLLHLVQLFHDRLCLRQTRRALVEQCCAGAAGLRAAGRVLSYLRAIPTAPGLKQILLTALEGFLAEATRHMQKHINVYSGAVIRGDGNYVQARKVAAEGDGGRDRPRTVLLAWVTVDGALYQPPTLSRSEDVKDALQDLGPLAGSFKQDRLEAGLSLVDSAPAVHATDVYGRQRLQLNAFYRRMYPGLDADAAAGAPTPRGDATGARTRFAGSPTTVTGDPLHDTLAVMQLISAASPDARNMCYDHKGIRLLFGSTRRREDILNRLSLPPRRPAAAAPVPAEQLPSAPVAGPPDAGAGGPAAQPLAVEHHEMLRKAVENTKEQTAETIRENPASADAVAAYLKQPQVDQEPTWRTIFGASPTRGAVLRLCAAFGVHAHDTLGYHGFETLACFKNAIRTHLKWYAPGRKTCRAHYDRLLKPLRLEGLWKWRDAALAIADAGAPLQTGAVAVERWWASLKHMMPAKAVCISERPAAQGRPRLAAAPPREQARARSRGTTATSIACSVGRCRAGPGATPDRRVSPRNMRVAVILRSGRQLADFEADPSWHLDDVLAAMPRPDGEYGCRLRVFFEERELLATMTLADIGAHGGCRLTCVTSEPRRIATRCGKMVYIWSAATGARLHELEGHLELVVSANFSPDGGALVLTSGDGGPTIIWSAADGKRLRTLPGHRGVFSPDSLGVVTLERFAKSKCPSASVRSVLRGQRVLVLSEHLAEIHSAIFSPDGRDVLTASQDWTAKLWSASSGVCLCTFRGHGGPLLVAVFAPSGREVLTTSTDMAVRIWSATTSDCLRILESHQDWVHCAAFSPSGQQVLTASWDGTAIVRPRTHTRKRQKTGDSGGAPCTLGGPLYDISSAAFSPDGRRVVTASHRDVVKVWSAATGECLLTMHGAGDIALFAPCGKSKGKGYDNNGGKGKSKGDKGGKFRPKGAINAGPACWNCGITGHKAENCWKPKRTDGGKSESTGGKSKSKGVYNMCMKVDGDAEKRISSSGKEVGARDASWKGPLWRSESEFEFDPRVELKKEDLEPRMVEGLYLGHASRSATVLIMTTQGVRRGTSLTRLDPVARWAWQDDIVDMKGEPWNWAGAAGEEAIAVVPPPRAPALGVVPSIVTVPIAPDEIRDFYVARKNIDEFGSTPACLACEQMILSGGKDQVELLDQDQDPYFPLASPDCKMFTYLKKLSEGKYKDPEERASWKDEWVQWLASQPGVFLVESDMCQFGMVGTRADGSEGPVRKPTGWLTNSAALADLLARTCSDPSHDHVPLLGGRASMAREYPVQLRKSDEARGLVRGDDFMVVGDDVTLADVNSRLASKYDMKCSGVLGPEEKDSEEVVFLNRVLRCVRGPGACIEIESDQRHVDTLLRDHGLEKDSAKGVDVPSSKKSVEDALKELELPVLGAAGVRAYRSGVMRVAYLAQDRPDIGEAVKSLTRKMQHPSVSDLAALKKLCRYLKKYPCLVSSFFPQAMPKELSMSVGTGCAGGATGLLIKAILEDFGFSFEVHVVSKVKDELSVSMASDSSAARAFAHRQGLDKQKHVMTKFLWIQEKVLNRLLKMIPVGARVNVADLLTKWFSHATASRHLKAMGFVFRTVWSNLHRKL
ncbi:unnamed protein product [Prorocentrum cordatum]|uniref:CCHC-type domain-containing protein n=1 Tax=Prorocentrum cordatum TaxID=2364126 RepID=A0ABN9RT36_9DINO|nr:unnamed protein product [Polarella glacialis]